MSGKALDLFAVRDAPVIFPPSLRQHRYPHHGRGVDGQLVVPHLNGTAKPSAISTARTSRPSTLRIPQCPVAPRWPHTAQRIRSRIMLLETSSPQRITKGASARGCHVHAGPPGEAEAIIVGPNLGHPLLELAKRRNRSWRRRRPQRGERPRPEFASTNAEAPPRPRTGETPPPEPSRSSHGRHVNYT
jgi:hypothetical protein